MKHEAVGAIIVAAGQSSRMGEMDKVFALLRGEPLLARVIEAFEQCEAIDRIVIVLRRHNLERGRQLAAQDRWTKVSALCEGGERRQDSVREGLLRIAGCQLVAVHDAARPLVTPALIERGIAEARRCGAAVAAVPVKDTIKVVSADGFVLHTPERATLWASQTPQVFRVDLLTEAHNRVLETVSDDSMMVERLGYRVKVYMGDYRNIKITTSEDLALAEALSSNE